MRNRHNTRVLDHHLPLLIPTTNTQFYTLPTVHNHHPFLQIIPRHLQHILPTSPNLQQLILHLHLILPHHILDRHLLLLDPFCREHSSQLPNPQVPLEVLLCGLEVEDSWLGDDALGYSHVLFLLPPFVLSLTESLSLFGFVSTVGQDFLGGEGELVPGGGVHNRGQSAEVGDVVGRIFEFLHNRILGIWIIIRQQMGWEGNEGLGEIQ